MSCTNATAPIDITQNSSKICNLQCSYSFTYPPTNLQIKHMDNYLSWKIDTTNMPSVIYNAQNYNVDEVRIYCPSLHTYATKRAIAEMVIIHSNTRANKSLLVCIPLAVSTTSTSDSVSYFDLVMATVSNSANTQGSGAIMNNPSFSLAKFVPRKPYFSYSGTLPYTPCNGACDYVVFHNDDAAAISTTAYNILKKVIKAHDVAISTVNTTGIFYNPNGPINPNKGEIYIDCRPTGDEGEVLVPLSKIDATAMFSMAELKEFGESAMTMIKLIVGAVLMFIIWKVSNYVIRKITAKTGQYSLKMDTVNVPVSNVSLVKGATK
jgi:carbonic anhydrase